MGLWGPATDSGVKRADGGNRTRASTLGRLRATITPHPLGLFRLCTDLVGKPSTY